jgi:predicted RNA-binding Zn ribbon-like protein
VDFVRYAERAAALVNADAGGAEQLMRLLGDRAWRPDAVAEKDIGAVRRFVSELRPVFEASSSGDARGVVDRLNALLAQHPVTPYISGHGGGGRDEQWHMHVADERSSVAELLAAEALMGLSTLVCDLGATRLGVCSAAPCTDVFVDTSPNRSRRYCSERCSSRANVAAFRARRRVQQAEHRAQASESRAATHD